MSFLLPPEAVPTPANMEAKPQEASDDSADAEDPDAALVAPVAVQADPDQLGAQPETDAEADSLTALSRVDTSARLPKHDAAAVPQSDGPPVQPSGPRTPVSASAEGLQSGSTPAPMPDEQAEAATDPAPEAASTRVKATPAATAQATAAMAATWEAAVQAGARKQSTLSGPRAEAEPSDIPDAPEVAEAPKLPATGHAHPQNADLQPKQDVGIQAAVARGGGEPAPDALSGPRSDAAQPLNDARPTGTATALSAGASADPTPRLSPQIVDAIRQTRDGTVDLSLSPEELGRVRLVLHGTDASLQVSVQTERPETLDLLRRHIGQLQADLNALGYKDVAFNFGQAGTGTAGSSAPVDTTASSGEELADLPATAQPVARNSAGGSRRLDLRL